VKITLDLPDHLLREAKATAARRGASFEEFFREALIEKLASENDTPEPPGEPRQWPVPPPQMSREDAALIDTAIEDAFEQIEPEDTQ